MSSLIFVVPRAPGLDPAWGLVKVSRMTEALAFAPKSRVSDYSGSLSGERAEDRHVEGE